jgi:hypothetical protein
MLTGVAGGVGAIGLPLLGAILAWVASRQGAPRAVSLTAIAANAAALVVVLAAVLLFGGS